MRAPAARPATCDPILDTHVHLAGPECRLVSKGADWGCGDGGVIVVAGAVVKERESRGAAHARVQTSHAQIGPIWWCCAFASVHEGHTHQNHLRPATCARCRAPFAVNACTPARLLPPHTPGHTHWDSRRALSSLFDTKRELCQLTYGGKDTVARSRSRAQLCDQPPRSILGGSA